MLTQKGPDPPMADPALSLVVVPGRVPRWLRA